ncbi:hypothetical protein KUCAC02_008821, partial [Chaenocephalus aceratus]
MFLWPKNDQMSRIWTKQVRRSRADFAGPGNAGSMKPTICGQHFERSCFDQSTMLAKEIGLKKNFKLNKDAVPTILPRPHMPAQATTPILTRPPMQSPPLKRRRNAFAKRERAKLTLRKATRVVRTRGPVRLNVPGRICVPNEIDVQTDPPPRIHHKSMQARPRFRSAGQQVRIHVGCSKGTVTTRTTLILLGSNEVPSSVHMEKEGLVRCVQFLESENLVMKTIVTDRHTQINKWLKQNQEHVDHRFDAHRDTLEEAMKGMQVDLLIGYEGERDAFPQQIFNVAVVVEETI